MNGSSPTPRCRPRSVASYEARGYRVIRGTLAGSGVWVGISQHADSRMLLRDITDEEVLEVLATPISSHSKATQAGRREARKTLAKRNFLVVYSQPQPVWVEVITAAQE